MEDASLNTVRLSGPVTVGGANYDTVITKEKCYAKDWVMNLPLRDPSPPVPRIFGLSCTWGVDGDGTPILHDGTPILHAIHLSFFSSVLVLHVAGWGFGDVLPQVLADLLSNPRNLFLGDEVNRAAATLGRSYGVEMPWTLDLGNIEGMCHVGEVPPHVVLARRMLDWPEGRLVTGGGEGPWTWPPSPLQVKFAVESSVVAQLLGHHMMTRPTFVIPTF